MAEKTFKCVGNCGKDFKVGEWECFPGERHKVALKTYYLNDAPHCDFKNDPDGMTFRASRSYVHIIPEKRFKDETGQLIVQAVPPVQFAQGQYSTEDPEQQYFIERAKIDVGYDRWFAAYHTPIQKQRIMDNSLRKQVDSLAAREAELKKKEQDFNDLLTQTQKQKRAEAVTR
jgi:hypothetical protein